MEMLFVLGLLAFFVWKLSARTRPTERSTYPARQSRRPSVKAKPVPKQYVVVDLETTGLHCERHEIIEIGAIRIDRDGEEHVTFNALVVPSKRIPGKITQLTGLTRKQLVKEGISLEEALPAFLEFCGDLPLVAYNAKFDRAFIERACSQVGRPMPSGEWHCALEVSRAAWPHMQSFRLSHLASVGGLNLDNEHRALGDCQRAATIYQTAVRTLLGEDSWRASEPY